MNVLITGANGGLGTAVCQEFLAAGAKVIGVARDWKQSAPFATIPGTHASVSTLCTVVGRPHSPLVAGNGGLERGFARLPSNALISAVSSPQM